MLDKSDERSKAPLAAVARRSVILAPLLTAACAPAVLDPAGPISDAEKTILIDSMTIMLAIVVPTIVATFAVAWWFRASNTRAKYLPEFEYSGQMEIVLWFIPLLTITLLGGVAWVGSHDLDPAVPLESDKPALNVQVVSMDWKWLFIYPQQRIATVNQLVIPAGVPVHFALTSSSVMNAFFIPQLGSMIYTMNGMTTQLNLQADAPGTFLGESSHYSGDGFSDMHFPVRAVPEDQFAAWVADTRKSGPTLDTTGYQELSGQSRSMPAFTYRAADPGLFSQIVTQKLAPGPGPDIGRPNPTVSPRSEK
jgi:cytochrome o ubiquinol oxidase subunit 2